jgi:hypothetical protein
MNDVITVPEEDRILVIVEEERTIAIPLEWRKIRVLDTMLVASKQHTVGDVRRWTVQYDRWLDNAVKIEQIDVDSDSVTCTTSGIEILGDDVVFFLNGGSLGERVTVTLTMTDDQGNIKHDTIKFTVVAP